ncbi:hypothetical protein RclHR1_03260007 [Rhizophagus clarus]|uniref:S-adenosyl-L-methionine-dependent methyltransferase n=1 Tax=Rhizophagus clarus TaxID=94130 RepID=A0A2Z6RN47_9GLOM|nr:hypothetical protein RclHR1_03260007 [Rhizophagus clarus]GES76946.1 S-adenosyl-L-methionine-dependent methyltransferase [Rhizophagus clarus]
MTSENYKEINCADSYKIIDGRRYLSEENTKYYLPNDEMEMSRISLEHVILRYIWQGNYLSNIEKRLIEGNTKVIDLGCGTGQWTIEMSSKYPLSTFIGIDIISSYFPSEEERPANLAFLQHNLVENPGVPFPDNTFDFTFMRNLAFSLNDDNGWFHVINEAIRVTNLDGCIEIANYDLYKDYDKEIHGGPIFSKLHDSLREIHEKDNIKMPTASDVVEYLKRTNQVTNIRVEEKASPLGSWGGRLGELTLLNISMAYQGFKAHLLPLMNISGDEYDNLLNKMRDECTKYKTRCFTYRVYGIKC